MSAITASATSSGSTGEAARIAVPFFRLSIAVARISAPGWKPLTGVTRRSCNPVAAVPITTILPVSSSWGRSLRSRLKSSYRSTNDTLRCVRPDQPRSMDSDGGTS